MTKRSLKIPLFIFLLLLSRSLFALSYSDITTSLSDMFYKGTDDSDGTTSFRSLLIPIGGRTEGLGSAFTGLCDDISFLRFNAAGGALQKETQLSVFHNSWVADSKLDTIAWTTRNSKLRNLSWGAYLSCFYLPFSEYNSYGDKVASNYYSETTVGFNASYNFLAGYDFKGLTLGATAKASWRGMPDYADDSTGTIISGSGLNQSGLALMADFGALLQFNFLKYYFSRDPNIRIGFSAQNVGAAFTGFGSRVKLDDSLPTYLAAGLSIKFLKPILLTVDFKQPVDLQDLKTYHAPWIGGGYLMNITSFLEAMIGFELKGGNPRFSAGFDFQLSNIKICANYTLDLTSSLSPVNRIGISTTILLGDKGRSLIDKQIDDYYAQGLNLYASGDYEGAIQAWEQILKLNRHFDPAIQGIRSARYQIEMFSSIKESMLFSH